MNAQGYATYVSLLLAACKQCTMCFEQPTLHNRLQGIPIGRTVCQLCTWVQGTKYVYWRSAMSVSIMVKLYSCSGADLLIL